MSSPHTQIRRMLHDAAIARRVVRYSEIFARFPNGTPAAEVFQELEDAGVSIAPLSDAIYTALLATRDTGCPGEGFYDGIRIHRHDRWTAVTGGRNPHLKELTLPEMRQMAEEERDRVYADAATRHLR